ncbi:hypothetical protein J2Z64_002274 [Oceanobacillus polygoni]|uniref:Uncharacterized protein n=1 Tax=Oceanobacillus polygoni TaxID=1235259 RepID=A0A9X0YSV0_9BACI|nr:hypothetical protein [Oceanobacillus polygoni]
MYRYVLNLNVQSNGDYEVHKEGCYKFPITNIKELGNHLNSESAIKAAEAEYPHLSIDECIHCAKPCHTR